MSDIRKGLYYHPIFGELRPMPEDEHIYEMREIVAGGYSARVTEPMETIYERDRRLWVEAAMLKQLTKEDNPLDDSTIKSMIDYYRSTYDLIQEQIKDFSNQ